MDIDMDATQKLRDQEWRDFIEQPTYKQVYEMMREQQVRIAGIREKMVEAAQRDQREIYNRLSESLLAPQKTLDQLAATLGDAFAMEHPSPMIVIKTA
ncbi:hypothetical protein [Hyphomonas sp.]|uniref:hypothetical protein n=1 Tax=Hyphomonas sp. TaxID=87 RepID=UPI0030038FFE